MRDEHISGQLDLNEVNTPVGQIRKNGSAYENIYKLSDHLGNVRVTFTESGGTGNGITILSYNDYYAWGGTLPGRSYVYNNYRYAYQGQEKPEDESLWDQFELRLYNHDLGRWSSPDPYSQFHSPYLAMANNPVSNTDPDGGYTKSFDPSAPNLGGTGALDLRKTLLYYRIFGYNGSGGIANGMPEMQMMIFSFLWQEEKGMFYGIIPKDGRMNNGIQDGEGSLRYMKQMNLTKSQFGLRHLYGADAEAMTIVSMIDSKERQKREMVAEFKAMRKKVITDGFGQLTQYREWQAKNMVKTPDIYDVAEKFGFHVASPGELLTEEERLAAEYRELEGILANCSSKNAGGCCSVKTPTRTPKQSSNADAGIIAFGVSVSAIPVVGEIAIFGGVCYLAFKGIQAGTHTTYQPMSQSPLNQTWGTPDPQGNNNKNLRSLLGWGTAAGLGALIFIENKEYINGFFYTPPIIPDNTYVAPNYGPYVFPTYVAPNSGPYVFPVRR